MKMTNDDILDYVDGTLSPDRLAQMEAFLRANPDEAALAQEMKEARVALLDWHQSEPVRVSDDFWQKVRAQLPEGGPRQSFARKLGAWLWPTGSPAGLSARVAALAAVAAIAAFSMLSSGPEGTRQEAIADAPTSADLAFMKRASKQHNAFETTPDGDFATVVPGDAASQDGDDSDDPEGMMP